ncbi:hypothetical protein Hanom_Chr04g00358661 [Helianthus anomalus]
MFYYVFSIPFIPNRFEQSLGAILACFLVFLKILNIGFVFSIRMNIELDGMMIHHTMRG